MLRVVTLACTPTAPGRRRDWCTCKPLPRGKRTSVRYWRNDSSSNDCSRNGRLPLSPDLHLSFSSAYYLSSPNSRRSPSACSSPLLPNLFFLLYLLLLLGGQTRNGSATVTVVPDPPLLATTNISTKSFHRTPISARRGGTVARGKLQSSGIKGGSEGRGRGRKRGGRNRSGP